MQTHPHPRKQQGATLLFVALWMGIILAALMILDIGNLVWQKRELQKIADLSALSGATGGAEACSDDARLFAEKNGAKPSEIIEAKPVFWVPGVNNLSLVSAKNANACQVRVERYIPYFFIFGTNSSSRHLSASAIAAMKPKLAAAHIRSTLLTVTSERERNLLNLLVGGLLGGNLNISLLGWNGLANTDLNLLRYIDALSTSLSLTAGDYDSLLNTKVSVGKLIEVMADVVRRDNPTATATIAALDALKVRANVSNLRVAVGDLLDLGTGSSRDALSLSVNVLELVQAFLQIGNGDNALATVIEVPLLKAGVIYQGVKVGLKVIEKPQWKIGNPDIDTIETKTAQVRLSVSLDLLTVDVDLGLKVGGAQAKLEDYSCTPNQKSMSFDTSSAILEVDLSLHYGGGLNLIVPRSTIGPVHVKLPGKKSTGLLHISSPNPPPTLDTALKAENWKTVEGHYQVVQSVGELVKKLIADLSKSSGGLIASLVKFLGWVLTPVSTVLEWIIEKLLSPLLDPLINEVLKVLGIDLAQYQVAGQLNCGGAPELVY